MNNANLKNTGKYAVAGGNEEIIHLCEQNHSSFEDAYETAIEFHRNIIFKYLYENQIIVNNNKEELGIKCITYYNFEILSFLLEEGMIVNDNIIYESVKNEIYLIKYFHEFNKHPKNILVLLQTGNFEIVKYVLEQNGIDNNFKDILFY